MHKFLMLRRDKEDIEKDLHDTCEETSGAHKGEAAVNMDRYSLFECHKGRVVL